MTLRFRALQRYSYARALLALTELARTGPPGFSFGPLNLSALESQGLTVTSESPDLIRDVLGRVPGVIEVPA